MLEIKTLGGRLIDNLEHVIVGKRDALELTPAWRERKLMRHGDTVMRFLERAAQ